MSMTFLIQNHSLQTSGSPEVITSTTILRNVVENKLGNTGTPHPINPNWAPLLIEKQDIQLPWPSKLGKFQQRPLTIGLKSEFPSPL